jgi:F0F1-type ATP synthase membrane subunit b/b'
MSIGKTLPFRSPISKLLRFFYRSRDKWKAKCKAAKRENKSLKYCLAKMKESRDRWKAEVRSLRKSLQAEAEPVAAETKNHAEHGSRGRRRARSGFAAAR